jgi:hypothetical protein
MSRRLAEDCPVLKPLKKPFHSHWCEKPKGHAGRHLCGHPRCRFSWNHQGMRPVVICLDTWLRQRQAQEVAR